MIATAILHIYRTMELLEVLDETSMTNKFDTYRNDYRAPLEAKFYGPVSMKGIIKKRIRFGIIFYSATENYAKT